MQIVKFKRLSFKLSVLFPPPERHEELALRPLHILTLFQTQKYNFPPSFSDQTSKIDTRFQTWRLDRKFVIIAYIRAQTKKFLKSIFEFAYFSFILINLELKR